MMEVRYKEALGNLDPAMRVCLLYLDNQIKEIRVSPLKAFQELEEKVSNGLSLMEQRDKMLEEIITTVGKLQDEIMEQKPTGIEKKKDECMQEINDVCTKYLKDFEKIQDAIDQRNKEVLRINKDLSKFFRTEGIKTPLTKAAKRLSKIKLEE